MKRTNNFFRALSLLLCLLTLTGLFAACKKISTLPLGTFAPSTADEFCLTVTDLDGTQKEFVVKTDRKNVADALVEVGLVSGENSEYGLYIKVVNGITADYSVDGSYWSLLVNGEMSMVGASSVPVAEGLRVELKKTK